MSGETASRRDLAFELAGWVGGGLELGFLADAPAWWVDGVRDRLGQMETLYEQTRAQLAVLLARPVTGA